LTSVLDGETAEIEGVCGLGEEDVLKVGEGQFVARSARPRAAAMRRQATIASSSSD